MQEELCEAKLRDSVKEMLELTRTFQASRTGSVSFLFLL
jgi:hypothetical protein